VTSIYHLPFASGNRKRQTFQDETRIDQALFSSTSKTLQIFGATLARLLIDVSGD